MRWVYSWDWVVEIEDLCDGGNGQMSSLSLESVLISNIGDGVGDAIISQEAVGSTSNDGSGLRSEGLQLSLLLLGDTITGLETIDKVKRCGIRDTV